MLFCTTNYVLFLAAVVVLFWLTPWPRGRVWLLLLASFVFYASWNKWLAALVIVTSAADYLAARGMDAIRRRSLRRALLVGSLAMNLGLLCYFKYVNFFLDSLAQTLHALGGSATLPTLSVILPIGISFYTFEAINYAVDVYRRKIPAERRLDHFMLFILFFRTSRQYSYHFRDPRREPRCRSGSQLGSRSRSGSTGRREAGQEEDYRVGRSGGRIVTRCDKVGARCRLRAVSKLPREITYRAASLQLDERNVHWANSERRE